MLEIENKYLYDSCVSRVALSEVFGDIAFSLLFFFGGAEYNLV